MRFSVRALFVIVTVIAIVAALIGGAIRGVNRAYSSLEDFYAIHQTHAMLYDYISAKDNSWPSSWDELKPYFDKHKNLGWSEDIESLKNLVDIDFTFNPNELIQWENEGQLAPLKLVSLKSYRNNIDWEELEEVNRRLVGTLRAIRVANEE